MGRISDEIKGSKQQKRMVTQNDRELINAHIKEAYALGRINGKALSNKEVVKILISLAYRKKGKRLVRININHLDVIKRLNDL